LSCTREAVGVDEAADRGVVITGLQVIESGVLGTVVARESKISIFSASPAKETPLAGLFQSGIRFTAKRIDLYFMMMKCMGSEIAQLQSLFIMDGKSRILTLAI